MASGLGGSVLIGMSGDSSDGGQRNVRQGNGDAQTVFLDSFAVIPLPFWFSYFEL